MIVFIKLVKRVSILHEKFFIYSKHFTNNTILQNTNIQTHQINNSPNKQYFRILNNTSEYFQNTNKQTTKQYKQPTIKIN